MKPAKALAALRLLSQGQSASAYRVEQGFSPAMWGNQ